MRFQGKIYRDGRFWLAEIPMLEAMTQGRTRREALEMIGDWIETMVDRVGFSVTVYPGKKDTFEVGSSDIRNLVSLLLRRRRESSGLSLAEAAPQLGVQSRNAYARYEKGESLPTIEKLDSLLRAVSDGRDFVVAPSSD